MRYVSILFQPKQATDLPHSGGIYTPDWAGKLWRGIDRNSAGAECRVLGEFHRDDPSFFERVPLVYPERDWSSLMEMFRPEVVGPEGAILLGLDTIIVGDLTPLEEACKGLSCVAPLDPYRKPEICNAVVYVSQEKAEEVWSKWVAERDKALHDAKYRMMGKFSEMMWLREHLNPDAYWDDLVPGAIQSFKVDLNQGPPRRDTKMVYFHGRHKPHQVKQGWVAEHWR